MSDFLRDLNERCMGLALEEAKMAFRAGEVPVGAVVVDPYGEVIACGCNKVDELGRQSAHAEIIAIDEACRQVGDWRLEGCSLYVTLEPCPMCMGLARLCRLERVIYGADSPLFGYQLDNDESVQLYKSGVPEILSGVCATDSAKLLRSFFEERRGKCG